MNFSSLSLALVVALSLALGACATTSSTLACPLKHGVTCMSAPDVYHATNSVDEIRSDDPKEAAPATPVVQAASTARVEAPLAPAPATYSAPVAPSGPPTPGVQLADTKLKGDSLAITGATHPYVAGPAPMNAMAPSIGVVSANVGSTSAPGDVYREPAKIMRIFIRPWEDESGDLHMGGIIYSEIEPRKWSVAQRGVNAAESQHFELLSSPSPRQDTAQEATKQTTTATPSAARPEATPGGKS